MDRRALHGRTARTALELQVVIAQSLETLRETGPIASAAHVGALPATSGRTREPAGAAAPRPIGAGSIPPRPEVTVAVTEPCEKPDIGLEPTSRGLDFGHLPDQYLIEQP
jgi:hypothetical protein